MLQPGGPTLMTSVLLSCVQCVPDSTALSSEVLRNIEKGSELKDLVQPLSSSSPLIFRHHSYTHISVDPSWRSSDFQVLFLTLREYSSSTWWRRWGWVEVLAPALHLHMALMKVMLWVEALSLFETGGV